MKNTRVETFYAKNEIFKKENNLSLIKTIPDGDCFFESVKIALDSINNKYTIQELRHEVAKRTMDLEDEEMDITMKGWMMEYPYYPFVKEIAKLFQVDKVKDNEASRVVFLNSMSLDIISRKYIYNIMMTKRYWGDDTSLRTLERTLNAQFLIFSQRPLSENPYVQEPELFIVCQPVTFGEKRKKNDETLFYMILLHTGSSHYDLIGYRNPATRKKEFVFQKKNLPPFIHKSFQKFLVFSP